MVLHPCAPIRTANPSQDSVHAGAIGMNSPAQPAWSDTVALYFLSPFSAAVRPTAAVGLLGWSPRLKRFGGVVAGLFGGPRATYTAVLLSNTAVPSGHEFHDDFPIVFGGSVLVAGGGLHGSRAARRIRAGAEDGDRRGVHTGGDRQMEGAHRQRRRRLERPQHV